MRNGRLSVFWRPRRPTRCTIDVDSAQRDESVKRTSLVLYVIAIDALAGCLLLLGWVRGDVGLGTMELGLLGYWFTLSLAAESFWLETPTGRGMVSSALAINLAALFVLPAWHVLAIGALSVGLADLLLHRRSLLKASFNAAQTTVALAGCVGALRVFGVSHAPDGFALMHHPWATLVVPVVFFLLNTFLVSAAISLETRRGLFLTWRENYGFGYQVLSSAVLFLIGLALVAVYDRVGYISGLFFLVLLYFVRDAYHRFVRERRMASGSA